MAPPVNSGRRDGDLLLGWPAPAACWSEAAPVGNGRLGAMVFGGAHHARFQINDSTVWSGTPGGPAAALAGVLAGGAGPARLAEARAALRAGDHDRAAALLRSFQGRYSQEYLPYADLWLTLDGGDRAVYRGRTLNLDSGVVEEEMDLAGTAVRRLTWADAPTGTVCVALECAGGTTGLTLELTSPLRRAHQSCDGGGLLLGVEIPVDGAPSHEPSIAEPLRYAAGPVGGYDPFGAVAVRLATDGEPAVRDGRLTVRGASRVLVTLASATSAAAWWLDGATASPTRSEQLGTAAGLAARAAERGTEELLRAHQADLRALLGSASLRVGPRRAGVHDVARDVLGGRDERLTATVMFQLGRYLLASASRPRTGPPANLQGIWNDDPRPPWSSNYTINVNTQMNYWGAEAAGLAACHEPLFDLLDRMAEQGAKVAAGLYGARGWVAHHNTDPWGWTLPAGMGHGDPSWSLWMMGGAWLSQHLWDHYEFGMDTAFLRDRARPVLRGCAAFLLDWLVEDGSGGLGTLPSTSPENLFVAADGTERSLTGSTAMDISLIRAVLERCLAADRVLGLDDALDDRMRRALPRLPPPRISTDGLLREWAHDLPDADPHHRHLSHLVDVHPLGRIDPDRAPELAAAARRSLERRGPGEVGWSWAWKAALRARLRDAGDTRALFLEATRPLDGTDRGGLLPNLFCAHPPFQIDGNHGLTAALTEMVVQSHGGEVRLLPALPAEWPEGRARGIRCRGGLAVDFAWRDGELTELTVHRHAGPADQPVRVRVADRLFEVRVPAGAAVRLDPRPA